MLQERGNIIVNSKCPYCEKNYLMSKRSFANHVKYCDENPKVKENLRLYGKKVSPITIKKGKDTLHNNLISKKGERVEFTVICEHCGKKFQVKENEFEFPKKEHYYCSRSCANSRNHSDEVKNKISDTLQKHYGKNHIYVCEVCGNSFESDRIKKWCSVNCRRIYKYNIKKQNLTEEQLKKKMYKQYWLQCQFTFALSEFPEEFDFNLINQYGWYKAKNKGNNLNGISRDHCFSVNQAFKLKIDPYYISHPANCQLLKHNDNVSKYVKCDISIDELYDKVNAWNKKYGIYPNKINYIGLNL